MCFEQDFVTDPTLRCYGPRRNAMTGRDHIQRAAQEVLSHGARAALGALALDVVSRQAEARTLFAGEKFAEARAAEHQVTRTLAELPSGNLLTILERGPVSPHERALVIAFAVFGLGELMLGSVEGEAVLGRFIGHADWLEMATPYEVYPFVDAVLDPAVAELVWTAVGQGLLVDTPLTKSSRARAAVRLGALAASSSREAMAQLHRIAESAPDPVVRASALAHGGRVSLIAEPVSLKGVEGHPPRGGVLGLVRLLTGVALLQWLARLLGVGLGLQREVAVVLGDDGLELTRTVTLLGRPIREQRETHAWSVLAGAGRSVTYPSLHLLVGALALALGILVGGLFLFEGVRSGETQLLFLSAAAILAGGLLDLLLSVVVPGRRGTVAVDIRIVPRMRIRLAQVSREDADRFLDALSGRLAGPH